jgi:hypothetical protein
VRFPNVIVEAATTIAMDERATLTLKCARNRATTFFGNVGTSLSVGGLTVGVINGNAPSPRPENRARVGFGPIVNLSLT